MLLFIERYPYNLNDIVKENLTIRDVLKDIVPVPAEEKQCSFGYVGYCYSKVAGDVVFFLPKVVLTGEQNKESGDDTIFGASPQDIINFESDKVESKFTEEGYKEYKKFLFTLSIWIYRVICVYGLLLVYTSCKHKVFEVYIQACGRKIRIRGTSIRGPGIGRNKCNGYFCTGIEKLTE